MFEGSERTGVRLPFKRAARHRQFSVGSGAIFASRKRGFVDLLAATPSMPPGLRTIGARATARSPTV